MRRIVLYLALLCCGGASVKGVAVNDLAPPALTRQTAPDFARATLRAVALGPDGHVRLDAPGATQRDGVHTGTLESAVVPRAFLELLPSWNAVTPPGTWVELEVRADVEGRWTKYYSFGRWSSGDANRASLNGQGDADGNVLTDVLRLKRPARAYQYRLRLGTRDASVTPTVRLVAFTASKGVNAAPGVPPQRTAWGKVLNVPARSQMVYPGGQGWCSPTSVSMILAYWGKQVSVPDAAGGTFDKTYGGTGNWAFNAAYAAANGFTAYATRLNSLADVERHILAGVPVALSLGWKAGELPGAPLPKSDGHLIVVVGFDARGHVVVNDPAGKTDAVVRRTYDRAILERLWLGHSGGTVYVVYPEKQAG